MFGNTKKTIAAAVSAALLGAVAVPATASADSRHWGRHGGGHHYYHGGRHHYGHHHGGHGGRTAAIIGAGALGLIAGAAVANSNRGDDCYLRNQRYIDSRGYTRVRRIEVCR